MVPWTLRDGPRNLGIAQGKYLNLFSVTMYFGGVLMERMIIHLVFENGPIFGGIAIATMILYGLRKMIKNALPGDQEMLTLLQGLRRKRNQALRQSREAAKEISGTTMYPSQFPSSDGLDMP